MFQRIIKIASGHRFITFVIIVALVAGGYYGYKKYAAAPQETRYVLAAAEKGMMLVSVSGSGQVSASNQVALKTKVAGDVVYVGVKNGQEVKSGALLVQLDARDAQKAARDAETSLETAKLDLDEMLKPVDELELLQAENSLIQTKESKQKAEDNLAKAYEDGFNAVVSAFFDLPTVMGDLDDILYSDTIYKNQDNISAYADMVRSYNEPLINQYKAESATSYETARAAYDKNFQNYKKLSRTSDTATIEATIGETYETGKKLAEAFKNTDNLVAYVKDILTQAGKSVPAAASSHQATIRTDTGKINNIISSLLTINTTIKSSRETIISSGRTIKEKELSLTKLKAGADELAIRAQKINVQQKQDALATAKEKLADYYIRAPFAGVATELDVERGDSVSSGASALTLITRQQMAEIPFNEVDVAKIKIGQKATLTFDAVEGLTIAGEVAEMDTIGTVSQGVVNYDVKIIFNTQDERVKPGMSVSAAVITAAKQDVLMVPSSAVKTQGERSYVEVLEQTATGIGDVARGITSITPPRQVFVTIGLSNDTMTEIVSGLNEGALVVTQTVSAAASPQATQTQSGGFRIPGLSPQGNMRMR